MPEPTPRQLEVMEAARRGFEAYNRGDLDTVIEMLSPDFVVESVVGNVGTYHGRQGFLDFSVPWEEVWEEFRSDISEIEPVGDDHVLIHADQLARGRDGIEVTMQPVFAYEMGPAGLCTRMGLYFDRDQALARVREWGAPG